MGKAEDGRSSGATTRRIAGAALLVATAGVVGYGMSAGSSAAESERARVLRDAESGLRAEVEVATLGLRRFLDQAVREGAATLPISVEVVEGAWSSPGLAPTLPEEFEVAERLEFVQRDPAAAMAAWRTALAGPLDATARIVALRNVARLARAGGDASGAEGTLAEASQVRGGFPREVLLTAFDAARMGSEERRSALRDSLASGGYALVAPSERLLLHERLGGGPSDAPGLVALARTLDAGGTELRVVDVGAGRVAWRTGGSAGIHRFALAARDDFLATVIPAVRAGSAESVPDGAVVLPSPPFPPLRLGPAASVRLTAGESAAAARRTWLVPALSVALLLVIGTALFASDARRREAVRRRESAFLLAMTHELKTPIANVRLYADTIASQGAADPARVPGFAAVIAAEADRLRDRVEEALEVAAGRAPGNGDGAVLAPGAEVEAVAAQRRALHPGRDIVVTGADAAALPRVHGTVSLFRRVVAELLDNALKFAPSGPVRLALARRGDVVEVRVRDDGPGIPTRERERVFEPWVRLDDAVRRAIPGTGIGLTLVRRCAEACGGTVYVVPEGPPGASVCAAFRVAGESS